MDQQKPKELYRGITLDYRLLKTIRFYGVDIVPYYEPLIDEMGRKTDKAGNEYGVYLSDNYKMSSEIYAHTSDAVGVPIDKDFQLRIAGQPTLIRIPSVEVLYKVDPEKIDIHRPWITDYLKGTYHEDEWVAERIPASEYSMIRLTVGPDLLHDKQDIDVTNPQEAEIKAVEIVERRKQQLEFLYFELKKLPVAKRYQLDKIDLEIFKDIFGDNGVKYINYAEKELHSGEDFVKYLISESWRENSETIDFPTLRYIESIKQKMPEGFTVEDLIQTLREERMQIEASKTSFIQRKSSNGEKADTTSFDARLARVTKFIDKIEDKRKTSSEEKEQTREQLHRPIISEEVKREVIERQKQDLFEMKQQLLGENQQKGDRLEEQGKSM